MKTEDDKPPEDSSPAAHKNSRPCTVDGRLQPRPDEGPRSEAVRARNMLRAIWLAWKESVEIEGG